MRVQTNCDVILEWDGSKNLELAALDTFAKRMTGICGDCDGIRNEFSVTNDSKPTDEVLLIGKKVEQFALAEEAKEAGDTYVLLNSYAAYVQKNHDLKPIFNFPCFEKTVEKGGKCINITQCPFQYPFSCFVAISVRCDLKFKYYSLPNENFE